MLRLQTQTAPVLRWTHAKMIETPKKNKNIGFVDLSGVYLILRYNHPEITVLISPSNKLRDGEELGHVTAQPDHVSVWQAQECGKGEATGHPDCLQRSFCGWSRFTFNEMRGGPQGQPPGVPSILGTSKTLQKGKRHNKACLPRREKWNLSGPHHPYHCWELKPLLIVLRWQKHHVGAKKGFAIWYNPALQTSRNSTNHQKHDERYTCHSLHCFWSSRGISGHHPQCTSVDSSKSTASGFRISTRFPSRYPYHSTKEHSIKKLIFTIWSPVWAKSLLQLVAYFTNMAKEHLKSTLDDTISS